MAHEIGHAFGLEHSDEKNPNALMLYGYSKYPDCYLTDQDLKTLAASPFFNPDTLDLNDYQEKYIYNGGSFTNFHGNWKEGDGTGFRFEFNETSRDKAFIYLYDESRGMKLRLPIQDGWCAIYQDGEWRNLYMVKKE